MTRQIPQLQLTHGCVQLIVDGQPFLMLAGELHNSSASSLEYMEPVWERVTALGCNTILAIVSWELTEPQEGQFDFTLVDGLLEGARRHGLKLVFLWFGTYKNTHSSYAPAWVKTDIERFFRAETPQGNPIGSISIVCEAAWQADARAFAQFMRHLHEVDSDQQTVLMVQVENETGILGMARDHCSQAKAAFAERVPTELISYLQDHRDALHPKLAALWEKSGRRISGTWAEVFGDSVYPDEVFMAWHVARFVGYVASAGHKEYPLPVFANAWLVQHDEELPGGYPSGGPVSGMIDIWRCAAPVIELLAPDIYIADFKGVCAEYHLPGNPLFIPEARRDLTCAAHAFYALAEHDALGFAPFGIDSIGVATEHQILGAAAEASFTIKTDTDGKLLSQSYRLLKDMMPVIAQYQGTGQMRGILQTTEEFETIDLGGYRLRIRFRSPWTSEQAPFGGLVIAVNTGEYIVAGFGFSIQFLPLEDAKAKVDILQMWEGDYRQGEWKPRRRLNGDEYDLHLEREPGVRHLKLYTIY